jgi:hypothetical protein
MTIKDAGTDFAEYETMIEDCENRDHRLTEWERDFLDSIKVRVESWTRLTPGQVDKLNEVWERVT